MKFIGENPLKRSDMLQELSTISSSELHEVLKKDGDKPLSPTLSEVVEKIFSHIDELDTELQEIKFPLGTKESPARMCRDIYLGHPEFQDGTYCTYISAESLQLNIRILSTVILKESHFPLKIFLHFSTAKLNLDFESFYAGWYWIDPNLGVPTDAIQVWCNVTSKGETCVYPDYKSRMVTFQFVLVLLFVNILPSLNVGNSTCFLFFSRKYLNSGPKKKAKTYGSANSKKEIR